MSQSLLIVEDEASIREPLVKYFGNNQFRVKAASNAAEARTLLASPETAAASAVLGCVASVADLETVEAG